jgi:hypothetical protein
MIILILFGLLQALILPGLVVSYTLKNIDIVSRIIIASALSLIINYLIVWLLYLTNLYSQPSLLIILAVEFSLLLYFRALFIKDVKNTIYAVYKFIGNILNTKSISFYSLLFILFCIYYFYLLKTSGFLTVFTHWDAVVSWNRWAVELHTGSFKGSWGYPQGIPVLFSIIYTLANETNIQTLVKYICVYWPFVGGVALFCSGLFVPKLKNVFALASIFYLYLLSKGSWTIDFIFSGLMDPFMAAFGAFFIYCILFISSEKTQQHPEYKKIVILSVMAVLGGALVKMTGSILIAYYLIFTYFIFINKNPVTKRDSFYFLTIVATTLLIATHWYLLTSFYWKDWPALSSYNSLQDNRVWIRPYHYLILFVSIFGWLFTSFAIIGAFSSKKVLGLSVLFILPLLLFCAIVVGYDLRASFVLFAPIALLVALGINNIYNLGCKYCVQFTGYLSSTHPLVKYAPLGLFFLMIMGVFMVASQVFSHDKILSANTEKRTVANDFAQGGNKRLLQIFEKEPNARIISCWQTPFGLPGAQGKFLPTGNCTVTLLTGWLADDNIKYWLYRDEGNSRQGMTPEFVTEFLSHQSKKIHAEILGSGYVLYSKE